MEGMAHKRVREKQEWVSSIQSKDIWTQSNWSEVGLRIGGSSRREEGVTTEGIGI